MKLAISNLAWNPDEDFQVIEVLRSLKVTGIELAPTKNWPLLETVTETEALVVRKYWESKDFEICALQSLLFGKPALQLFQDAAARTETANFLKKVINIASWLGAKALVLESAKNRTRGGLPLEKAFDIATNFFRGIGDYAAEKNCCLCIEPNPAAYACDFILTSAEGADLVKRVNSPGFGLHLDSAGMYLMEENIQDSIKRCIPSIKHFHLSAPLLAPLNKQSPLDYRSITDTLDGCSYKGWTSIEMKQDPNGNNSPAVSEAIRHVQA